MTNENSTGIRSNLDPTLNVRSIVDQEVGRLDDLRKTEARRFDEKIDSLEKSSGIISLKDHFYEIIKLNDVKYQIQFNAAKDAVGIASTAQEKAMAAALDGTKDALDKADVNNDKRFDGISQKITEVSELLNKNAGSQGIYVTHTDLAGEMDKLRTSFEAMLKPITTKLADVNTYMNTQTGRSGGVDASWSRLAMIIGITATIITLLIKFAV